jgi:hypothetical protein
MVADVFSGNGHVSQEEAGKIDWAGLLGEEWPNEGAPSSRQQTPPLTDGVPLATIPPQGGVPPWRKLVRNAGGEFGQIPPREWLLGTTFCRTFVSSLVADGGTGKTAIRIAQLMSLATGRNLTGEHVFQRSRVLMVTLEDDESELKRRIRAAMIHHNVTHAELDGWMFFAALGNLGAKFKTPDPKKPQPREGEGLTKIQLDLQLMLSDVIEENKIDLICLDPFIKSHSATENDNNAIDCVVSILTNLAANYNCAVDAPHHMSKGLADPGNANRGRGASAFKDGARLVYTLSRMQEEDGTRWNIPNEELAQYVRTDPGKVNIARSAQTAKWFKIVGVDLGNSTELYPHGDNVQTVEPWYPPEADKAIHADTEAQIIAEIDKGPGFGGCYIRALRDSPRNAEHAFRKFEPTITRQQVIVKLDAWLREGRLFANVGYRDANDRNRHRDDGLSSIYKAVKDDPNNLELRGILAKVSQRTTTGFEDIAMPGQKNQPRVPHDFIADLAMEVA